MLVQLERKKTSILVSKEESSSSSVCVSARDTPGPGPVPIAGDRGGVPGSSDPVSTAARRGNETRSSGAGCERMISILEGSND